MHGVSYKQGDRVELFNPALPMAPQEKLDQIEQWLPALFTGEYKNEDGINRDVDGLSGGYIMFEGTETPLPANVFRLPHDPVQHGPLPYLSAILSHNVRADLYFPATFTRDDQAPFYLHFRHTNFSVQFRIDIRLDQIDGRLVPHVSLSYPFPRDGIESLACGLEECHPASCGTTRLLDWTRTANGWALGLAAGLDENLREGKEVFAALEEVHRNVAQKFKSLSQREVLKTLEAELTGGILRG